MTVETARSFKDLIVWRKAHEFVLEVYSLTASFPKSEIYGLTSQFRRSAISIPANIAEGLQTSRHSRKSQILQHSGSILRREPLLITSGA
jgi:four helix bundle protein